VERAGGKLGNKGAEAARHRGRDGGCSRTCDVRPGPGTRRRRPRTRACQAGGHARTSEEHPRTRSTTGSRTCASAPMSGSRRHRRPPGIDLPGRVRARRHGPPPRGRAARYTFGDVESLAFGRLDLADGDHLHVGRVSSSTRTARSSSSTGAPPPPRRSTRRPQRTRWGGASAHPDHPGRELRDLDDELIDARGRRAPRARGGHRPGRAARGARTRGPAPCATSSRRSRPIRTGSSAPPATGTLVVTGGPGTGKTVVALHRVASLLYQDRARFEGRGVLVVGPSGRSPSTPPGCCRRSGRTARCSVRWRRWRRRGSRSTGWDTDRVWRG
jgi:hypothetical protein